VQYGVPFIDYKEFDFLNLQKEISIENFHEQLASISNQYLDNVGIYSHSSTENI